MGWTYYPLRIGVSVDSHGGEKERRGNAAYEEFMAELQKLCEDERFNNDAIRVTL
jgi:hypothetical protein